MLLSDLLLALMMGLPPHYLDREDVDARRSRLGAIAVAIDDASARATCSEEHQSEDCQPIWKSRRLDLALLLVTEAFWESRLARNVHEGKCRQFECDPHRNPLTGALIHRSRTIWQMQRTRPIEEEWNVMVGTSLESTRSAAWAASKLLSLGYNACHTIRGAISRYAGLARCDWSGAKPRVQFFEQLRLRATRASEKDSGRLADTVRSGAQARGSDASRRPL